MPTKKLKNRKQRHARVRAKIKGTVTIPRVSVFRSNTHFTAQIIDDISGKTLAQASDIVAKKDKKLEGTKTQRAELIAEKLAQAAAKVGVSKVVFDRGGFKYHGRVKAFAEALRKNGLQF